MRCSPTPEHSRSCERTVLSDCERGVYLFIGPPVILSSLAKHFVLLGNVLEAHTAQCKVYGCRLWAI